MKSVLLYVMVAFSAVPAIAAPCNELPLQGVQEGVFDTEGKVCFRLPALNENYVVATLKGGYRGTIARPAKPSFTHVIGSRTC